MIPFNFDPLIEKVISIPLECQLIPGQGHAEQDQSSGVWGSEFMRVVIAKLTDEIRGKLMLPLGYNQAKK
jgi:hypothetical protein